MNTALLNPIPDSLEVLRDKFRVDERPLLWRVRCTECLASWLFQKKPGNVIADQDLLSALAHFSRHREVPE